MADSTDSALSTGLNGVSLKDSSEKKDVDPTKDNSVKNKAEKERPVNIPGQYEDLVVIRIHGHLYDVTDYIDDHPGEGHNDLFLEDYAGKDCSEEFDYYHAKTLKSNLRLLKRAREKGEWQKIIYIGPDLPESSSSEDDSKKS